MKKKIGTYILIVIITILSVITIVNAYKWIRTGNQTISINTPNKIYSNSDLYITVEANKNGENLETAAKVKLLDSNKREVKGAKVSYTDENCIISIPDVETGSYIVDAYVTTKEGDDTVQKSIYISNGAKCNYTITLDKGIYKPGDTVNYRTLITSKTDNKPIKSDVNICIYDGNNNKVYNEKVTTSNYGILSGSFNLANEVNSGIYRLVVSSGQEEETKSFKVNPYITPKYEVKIETDKKNYIINETADISITAKYFFGEPASGTKYVVYINGKEYTTLMADNSGNANFKYDIKLPQIYNIKVEAIDTSNYYVEQSTSFAAGNDKFEISLLPEYGELIKGQNNKIYVFTKTTDGKPLKTYVTVTMGTQYTKQVVTNEDGIGEFSVFIDDSSNKDTIDKKTFKVSAENMQKETVNKEIEIDCGKANLLISTDKVKYTQGEDIKINISSAKETKRNIYFFKNDKLINQISTDSEETSVNLGDAYGLIDILVSESNGGYRKGSTYQKIIFIKPKETLNIGIKTDKEEYKPGENIKISFDTKTENNDKIDAALLVSMLDNAILNLADNDLSIDNIKLALSDINFTDELDAATLYSCILDDNSEQTMTAILLKQKNRDINVSGTKVNNYSQKRDAAITCVCCAILLVIILLAVLYAKFPKFRVGFKHTVNAFMYFLIMLLFIALILDRILYSYDLGWIEIGAILVISISSYAVLLSKISDELFKTTKQIFTFVCLVFATGIVFRTDCIS